MRCSFRLVICLAGLGMLPLAWAQYQWIDASGHRVYSDLPPPVGTPANKILGGAAVKVKPAPTPAVPAAGSAVDPGAAALQKKLQQAEAERKAAEEAQRAKLADARAENCRRARDYKRTLDSGMRIAQLNKQGERVVLDDAARTQERQRAEALIGENCNGAGN